jgi:GNAT superfamily N-acetyltransferase
MRSEAEAAEIRELEDDAYRLWVAPEVEELDGWLLRHAHGLTGRGNSVFPRADGRLPLEERIERVEAWYAERGLPGRFQLTAASVPGRLAEALAARGYALGEGVTSVQTAPLGEAAADLRVELFGTPDDTWIDLWTGSRGFADAATAFALLTGSPGETVFARIGEAAVGRAVAWGGRLGITSMVTVPTARRQGLARAVVATVFAWARERGCTTGLLQVERDNAPAQALYASFGFVTRYEYAYALAPPVAVR